MASVLNEDRPPMTRTGFAVGLLSLSLIAFQLHLMQVLAIVQWHHFGAMVVSIALLGFGAAGSALTLSSQSFLKAGTSSVPLAMILCGLTMCMALPLTQSDAVRFDSLLVFVRWMEFVKLAATYVILFLPFFFGAFAIAVLLTLHVDKVGLLYFANLAGSGAGAILAVATMWFATPSALPAMDAFLPLVSSILALPSHSSPESEKAHPRSRAALWLFCTFSFFVASYLTVEPQPLEPSQYKSMTKALNLPGASIVRERFSPYGHVQVVTSPALRFAPGLSLTYAGVVPVLPVVFNNADWFGAVPESSLWIDDNPLGFSTSALPYRLRQRESTLILQSAAGEQAAFAVSEGVRRVTAVEVHAAALDAARSGLDSALYLSPAVRWVVENSRSVVDRDTGRVDLIVLPTLGAFGGTSGLTALQEQYLLTVEAFGRMWERLTPSGGIAVTTWNDHPPRNVVRALTTIVEMLRRTGIRDVQQHLLAVRSWATVTLVVSRNRVTQDEINAARAFCERLNFDMLLAPDIRAEERTLYNTVRDTALFALVDGALGPDRERLIDSYEFSIGPVTDNAPYFSQFLRLKSIGQFRDAIGGWSIPFVELGTVIAVVTLVQVTLGAVVLIVIPLLFGHRTGEGRGRTLLYFGSLGFGYMLVEVVLMQRFILTLGHPIYAAAFVIGTMLCFSGLGSLWSGRFTPTVHVLRRLAFMLAAGLGVYAFALAPLLQATLSLESGVRWVASLALIGPAAFLMGMPFPLGLRYLARRSPGAVPWAWGINGTMSVVSASLAVLVSITAGFAAVLAVSAASYACAGMVFVIRWKNHE